MDFNNCTMYYYDWDWNWHEDNCTNNLSDVFEWNMEIKYSEAWRNESNSEAAHIFAFWYNWHEENDHDLWNELSWLEDNSTEWNSTDDWNSTEWNSTDDWNSTEWDYYDEMDNNTDAGYYSHWRYNTSLFRNISDNVECELWWGGDEFAEAIHTLDCYDFDMYDWQWYCEITYVYQPCHMDEHSCRMQYYDMNGEWIDEDCTAYLEDPDWWYYYSGSDAWNVTDEGESIAYVWSYWEYNYQDNIDWEEYDDLDWQNPNCNATNITAESSYYLDCDDFIDGEEDENCGWITYRVESCDLSNYTCEYWY